VILLDEAHYQPSNLTVYDGLARHGSQGLNQRRILLTEVLVVARPEIDTPAGLDCLRAEAIELI